MKTHKLLLFSGARTRDSCVQSSHAIHSTTEVRLISLILGAQFLRHPRTCILNIDRWERAKTLEAQLAWTEYEFLSCSRPPVQWWRSFQNRANVSYEKCIVMKLRSYTCDREYTENEWARERGERVRTLRSLQILWWNYQPFLTFYWSIQDSQYLMNDLGNFQFPRIETARKSGTRIYFKTYTSREDNWAYFGRGSASKGDYRRSSNQPSWYPLWNRTYKEGVLPML